MSKRNIRDHWNSIALDYQKNRKLTFDDIVYAFGYAKESELNLLPDVEGKKIVELGCGGAENCITLAKRGAICTGVDMSAEQLNYAKNLIKENNVNIELIEGDIENLTMFEDEVFDIAISLFALDWMQDLNAAFREAYRILKPNGIFVFSTQHPIYNLFGSEALTDLNKVKISESYFEKEVTFVEDTGIDLRVHASTISDIINGLLRVGFDIETILEPKPLERDVIPHEEWYRKEIFEKIPSTLICKVFKISSM